MAFSGKVKWFNPNKGYGFITPENGTKDIFLHISSLEKAGITFLEDGQRLEYEVSTNKGKDAAVNIKLLSGDKQ
jgi:CspA family cold shock protein